MSVHDRAVAAALRRMASEMHDGVAEYQLRARAAELEATRVTAATGSVHDHAIADYLRTLAAKMAGPDGDSDDAEWFTHAADELEASAPPATIDADYDGPEPPVGTVLASTDLSGWHRALIHADHDPELHMNYWAWTGSDESDFRWVDVLEHLKTQPWTVLRWGSSDD